MCGDSVPRPAYAAHTRYYKRAIYIVDNITSPVIAEAPSSVAHTTQGDLTTGNLSHVLHTSDSDTGWGLDGHTLLTLNIGVVQDNKQCISR